MSRVSRTPHAILTMLSLGPRSGYDIQRAFQASMHYFWNESNGQLYPALKSLVASGLARRTPTRAGRSRGRAVYAITARGRRELDRWLGEPAAPPVARNELLLKWFVGWNLPHAVAVRHIERLQAAMDQTLDEFRSIERFLTAEVRTNPDVEFWLIGLRSGVEVVQARRRWCDLALAELERRARRRERAPTPARAARMGKVLQRLERASHGRSLTMRQRPRSRR